MKLAATLDRAAPSARASALPCQIQNNSPLPRKGHSGGLRRPAKVELSDVPGDAAVELWRSKPAEYEQITAAEMNYARASCLRSVWACIHGEWSIVLVNKATGAASTRRFRCKSWRCPRCRFDVAKRDFARLVEAFKRVVDDGREWVLVTLTFDPSKFTGTPAEKAAKAYRSTSACWRKLRGRLERRYAWPDGSLAKVDYVQVWERHRSGMPHVHVALTVPGLAYDIRSRGLCDPGRHFGARNALGDRVGVQPYRFKRHKRTREWLKLENWAWEYEWLRPHLVEAGFGEVADVQLCWKGAKGIANYFAKLSAELCGMAEQRPVNAPAHFRRLRGSRGALPAAITSKGEHEGLIVHGDPANVEDYVSVLEAAGVRQQGLLCIDTDALRRVVCLTQRSLASAADDLFRSEASRLTSSIARAGPPLERDPAGARRRWLRSLQRKRRELDLLESEFIGPLCPRWLRP